MSEMPNMIEAIKQLSSDAERERDLAAEQLGDFIQSRSGVDMSQLQLIVDALGNAVASERSQVVLESILNALAHAKQSAHPLKLPVKQVCAKYTSLTGSSIAHANEILEGSE